MVYEETREHILQVLGRDSGRVVRALKEEFGKFGKSISK